MISWSCLKKSEVKLLEMNNLNMKRSKKSWSNKMVTIWSKYSSIWQRCIWIDWILKLVLIFFMTIAAQCSYRQYMYNTEICKKYEVSFMARLLDFKVIFESLTQDHKFTYMFISFASFIGEAFVKRILFFVWIPRPHVQYRIWTAVKKILQLFYFFIHSRLLPMISLLTSLIISLIKF